MSASNYSDHIREQMGYQKRLKKINSQFKENFKQQVAPNFGNRSISASHNVSNSSLYNKQNSVKNQNQLPVIKRPLNQSSNQRSISVTPQLSAQNRQQNSVQNTPKNNLIRVNNVPKIQNNIQNKKKILSEDKIMFIVTNNQKYA